MTQSSDSKASKANFNLNLAIFILILLGAILTWEKNNMGQDFLDNYVKDQTKWMILDMILFVLLALLIFVNRKSKCVSVYITLMVLLIVMKAVHMYSSHKLVTSKTPSGGNKFHLNDLFYGTLFDGIVLGVAGSYLLTHMGKH